METASTLFIFVFGLLIGSFINVLTLRFGFQEMPRHRSACQACQASLRWYELLPLVSYLFLRGKCRTCGSTISIQYPLVEFLAGSIFAVSFVAMFPFPNGIHLFSFALLLFFWSAFVLLLIYDVRHTLVPVYFVIPLFISALLIRVIETAEYATLFPLYDAFFGALALGGFMFLIVIATRGKGMGLGDVYIALVLGLFFGLVRGIEVLTMAFWIGAVVGLLLIARTSFIHPRSARRLSSSEKTHSGELPGKGFTPTPVLTSPHSGNKGDNQSPAWTFLLFRSVHRFFQHIMPKQVWGFTIKTEVPFIPFLFVSALIGAYTHISPLALINATYTLWY